VLVEGFHMAGGDVAVVVIDIYKSTTIKQGEEQAAVDHTFRAYHAVLDQALGAHQGERWHTMGDGAIYLFPDCRLAVGGAVHLLGDLTAFDSRDNRLRSSIHVRIGVSKAPAVIKNASEAERGRVAAQGLDIAGQLEKKCPVGKIAISPQVFDDLDNVQRRLFREPTVGPLAGTRAFVLEHRNTMPREQALAEGLSQAQSSALPPIPFRDWDQLRPAADRGLRQMDAILHDPLLVVLGETYDDPDSVVHAAATSDAIGPMEILAAMHANADVIAGIDRWADTADVAGERSLLIVGSGTVNSYAFAFNDLVRPVRFARADGRVVDKIVVQSTQGRVTYGPHAAPPADCGFVALFRSPVNPERHAVWVAGITGMGTQAAARFAFDLISDADATIRKRLGSTDFNPIACVVGATTPSGSTDISGYYRHWRITEYALVVGIDSEGRALPGPERPA
jgi:class 3 adenylate cyclase